VRPVLVMVMLGLEMKVAQLILVMDTVNMNGKEENLDGVELELN